MRSRLACCRALGRLRTTLAEPSVALPHKFRHRAQQKRLAAIRTAVAALRQTITFLRTVARTWRTQEDAAAAPLLQQLCAWVPADDDEACVLAESMADAVKESAGAAKGGKKGEAVLKVNEDLFSDYDGSGEEPERLEAEIPLATEIMGSLVEQTPVSASPAVRPRGRRQEHCSATVHACRRAALVCTIRGLCNSRSAQGVSSLISCRRLWAGASAGPGTPGVV